MPDPQPDPKPFILSPSQIAHQPPEAFAHPHHGTGLTWKTLTSASLTPTDTLTTGIATFAPGGHLGVHRHKQAEVYHILSGSGTVEIEGTESGVEEGSVVFIPGDAWHGVKNSGRGELKVFYVFGVGDFGEVGYCFAGDEGEGGGVEQD